MVTPIYDINKWPKSYNVLKSNSEENEVAIIESRDKRYNFLFKNGDVVFGGPIDAWPVVGYKTHTTGYWGGLMALLLTGTNGKQNILYNNIKRFRNV